MHRTTKSAAPIGTALFLRQRMRTGYACPLRGLGKRAHAGAAQTLRHHLAVLQHVHFLNIDTPAAPRGLLGPRPVVAVLRPFAALLTLCHDAVLRILVSILQRCDSRLAHATADSSHE